MVLIFKEYIKEIEDEIIAFRREIHMEPEIGHEEAKTAAKIKRELDKLDLDDIRTGLGGHGIAGTLHGKNPGKTLLIRADIDALPMQENNDLPYKSQIDGMMHACGHDVHTAILLGTAKVLSKYRDSFDGTLVFCFQPAEEANPEGGAQGMIDDGVLENPKVDQAIGLHIDGLPLGMVGYKSGILTAQSDRLFIKVKGNASHASRPHEGNDAILAAGHIITGLQSIVSRNTNPFEPLVITIGTIEGGDRYNVLCDEVRLEGTIRSFNPETSKNMLEYISTLAGDIAQGLGCCAEVEIVQGYTNVINDKEMTRIADRTFRKIFDEENIIVQENPTSGGEDFSAFGKYVPTFFYWLGMASDKNVGRTTLHSSELIVDEDVIAIGINAMVNLGLELLKE